jgi:hypothetical protein
MASTLMHLYVGRKLAQKYGKINDLPQFYLGCILPDSVNVDGFAAKEVRWSAHLRARDIDEWYENNLKLYTNNTGRMDENLLLGYVVHNITDAAWDGNFHDRVWDELERLKRPCIMDMGYGWDDCFRFDRDQSKESWWTLEVLPELKRAVPVGFNVIDENIVKRYLKEVTDEYIGSIPEGGAVLVNVEMVEELAGIVWEVVGSLFG